MIECFGVRYKYPDGNQALDGINLRIENGEFLGILGENGAGKTTLAKCINGLLKPQSGKIFIDGEDSNKFSVAQLSKKIGFVFQNSDHQIFAQTVEDEIKFGLKNLEFPEDEIEEKYNYIIKELNLEQYEDVSPFDLSGGERKRVALASILCLDPSILIMDEPTAAQDGRQKEYLVKLIEQLRTKGKTIIIITHDIEFASEYIPRIILMSNGKIVADGPNNIITSNEMILKKSSLIQPQLTELNKLLNTSEKFSKFKGDQSNVYKFYKALKYYL